MRLVHQVVGRALLEAGQVADQMCIDREASGRILAEPDLRGDAARVVQLDLVFACDETKRTEEAGGVAGREQLLGVGALAVAAGLLRHAGVEIDPAVRRLHVAVAAAPGCG